MQSIFSPVQPWLVFGLACLIIVVISSCEWAPKNTVLIGVMIDNHEDARAYQRGLDKALLVEEQFVEGYITRFLAFLDVDDLPASIGPIRSVRPYFIDGSSPVLSAIFHVGGSPEALERLQKTDAPESFNALHMDKNFTYDDTAPAPHHRFLTRESAMSLIGTLAHPKKITKPLFHVGSFVSEAPATTLRINFHSPIHNVTYTYDASKKSYSRSAGGITQASSPKNILILETTVEEPGPLGRLKIRMDGAGDALLFRDGGVQKGTWNKEGSDSFFTFSDATGKTVLFRTGQVWMIVLDDLKRVTYGNP